MKIATIPALLALSAVAQAALVKFSVIAPDAATVEVQIGGKNTALTKADPNVPLYTGQAETGAETKYKYVAAGRAEAFDRTVPTTGATYNEFLDRPISYANIPELPWPVEKDVSLFFFLHSRSSNYCVQGRTSHDQFFLRSCSCVLSCAVCRVSHFDPTSRHT